MLIFGNQRLLADSVAILLAHEIDIDVVANSPWGPGSASLAAMLNPDVVVIDFHLGDWTAGRAARAMSRAGTKARVIFLAPRRPDACMVTALEVGASAVVDLTRSAAELVETVRRVGRSEDDIALPDATPPPERRCAGSHLTSREVEVLNRLAQLQSSREIAATLGISYATVRTHLRNLSTKLAAHNRIDVIAKAQGRGLLAEWPAHAPAPPARGFIPARGGRRR